MHMTDLKRVGGYASGGLRILCKVLPDSLNLVIPLLSTFAPAKSSLLSIVGPMQMAGITPIKVPYSPEGFLCGQIAAECKFCAKRSAKSGQRAVEIPVRTYPFPLVIGERASKWCWSRRRSGRSIWTWRGWRSRWWRGGRRGWRCRWWRSWWWDGWARAR